MGQEETIKKIPKANEEEVIKIPSGPRGLNSDVNSRLDKIDQVLYGIMLAVVIAMITVVLSMIAIIVAVVGIFLDQMRYNNAAYTQYTLQLEKIKKNQIEFDKLTEENSKQEKEIELLNKEIEGLDKQDIN